MLPKLTYCNGNGGIYRTLPLDEAWAILTTVIPVQFSWWDFVIMTLLSLRSWPMFLLTFSLSLSSP